MFWFLKKGNLKFTVISAAFFLAGWAVCFFGIGSLLTGSSAMNQVENVSSGESFLYFFINNFLHCLVCVIGCGILSAALLLFNGATSAMYWVLIRLLGMEQLAAEFAESGRWMLAVMLVLGNLTFLLLDVLLKRLEKKFWKA